MLSRSSIGLFLVRILSVSLLSQNNGTDLYSYQTTGSNIIPLLRFIDRTVQISPEPCQASLPFFSGFRTCQYRLVCTELCVLDSVIVSSVVIGFRAYII